GQAHSRTLARVGSPPSMILPLGQLDSQGNGRDKIATGEAGGRPKSALVGISRDILRGRKGDRNHECGTFVSGIMRTEKAGGPHLLAFARICPHFPRGTDALRKGQGVAATPYHSVGAALSRHFPPPSRKARSSAVVYRRYRRMAIRLSSPFLGAYGKVR